MITVYTDGAYSSKTGLGGWAWATDVDEPVLVTDRGWEWDSTNQRMELKAALEAVRRWSGQPAPVVVVSDSAYVVNCFRDRWYAGWLIRDWRTRDGKPIKNRDLWEPLVELVTKAGNVTFRWVKGHSGDPMNELVDQLAVRAREEV